MPQSIENDFVRINAISLYNHTLPKHPCPGGHEIHNFGSLFLGLHNYILSLSVVCLGVEKKILKEIMHFHYTTCMTTPKHKNPCPMGHEIYNFGRPFLGLHRVLSQPNAISHLSEKSHSPEPLC